MLERAEELAARAATARAEARREALAEALRAILPETIHVAPEGEGVAISGPGLGRRIVVESSLRWTIAGLLR